MVLYAPTFGLLLASDPPEGLGKALGLTQNERSAAERKAALEANAYALTNDPKQPMVAPPALETPPYLNFAPLDNALATLDKAAAHYNNARDAAAEKTLPPATLSAINQELARAEQKLTSAQGLPRRPWMQHLLYAPGWFTGYGAKTLPGPREAIEERRYADADAEIARVAGVVAGEAAYVEHLAGELEGGTAGSASSPDSAPR